MFINLCDVKHLFYENLPPDNFKTQDFKVS